MEDFGVCKNCGMLHDRLETCYPHRLENKQYNPEQFVLYEDTLYIVMRVTDKGIELFRKDKKGLMDIPFKHPSYQKLKLAPKQDYKIPKVFYRLLEDDGSDNIKYAENINIRSNR